MISHESDRPRLARHVHLRFDRRRNTWVLLAPETVVIPDETALEILRRCDGATSICTIVDGLAEAYDADRAEIARDVLELLGDLADRGLIEA